MENDVNEMMAMQRLAMNQSLYGDNSNPARPRSLWRRMNDGLARIRSRVRDAWDVLLGRAFIE